MATGRRANPLAYLLHFATHAVALLILLTGLYFTFFHASFFPVGVALALVSVVEGVWLFCTRRK